MSEFPEKYQWRYLKLAGREVVFSNENINRLPLSEIIERLQFKRFDNWVQAKTNKHIMKQNEL